MPAIETANCGSGLDHMTVLYVEDDEEIREQLAQFLRRRVRMLYTAENGRQGLDAYQRHRPDIVVSDIRMPEMDGLEMADRIKRDSSGAPIILTSAFSDTDYFLRSIDIGVDKYVLKPIRTEVLETALHRVAENLRAQSELKLAAAVFENVSEGILVADAGRRIVTLNPAFQRMTGFDRGTAVDREVSFLDPEDVAPAQSWSNLASSGVGQREILVARSDGSVFIGWATADVVRRPDGSPVYLVFVLADISERKEAENALKRMNELLEARVRERTASLEQANRELEAFSYSVSHDLSAPLRAIDGFSRILEADFADRLDGVGRNHLQRICAATQRMQHLIDDLLALARISRTIVNRETFSLSALAMEIAAELSQQHPARTLDWAIEPNLVAHADPSLIRIALDNLLRNAWKFTAKKPRPRVEFGAAEQDGQRIFFIRDNGAGFDAKYLGQLFQPFKRLHSVTEFEGTGIGLAIVDRIIRRHGGRVWAEARADEGATFYFTLGGTSPLPN